MKSPEWEEECDRQLPVPGWCKASSRWESPDSHLLVLTLPVCLSPTQKDRNNNKPGIQHVLNGRHLLPNAFFLPHSRHQF